MFRSVSRVFARVVKSGRIGRKRSFAAALGLAMLVLPVSTALAFFTATGQGTISNVQAGAPSSVIAFHDRPSRDTHVQRPINHKPDAGWDGRFPASGGVYFRLSRRSLDNQPGILDQR